MHMTVFSQRSDTDTAVSLEEDKGSSNQEIDVLKQLMFGSYSMVLRSHSED